MIYTYYDYKLKTFKKVESGEHNVIYFTFGGKIMAKLKGKGLFLAGLVAGVASILSKKGNRDKAKQYLTNTKSRSYSTQNEKMNKTGPFDVDKGNTFQNLAETAGDAGTTEIRENNMIAEGAATAVRYYNETNQEEI